MKNISRILTIVFLLISLAGALGCSHSSDNPNNTAAANMMQLLPDDLETFEFFDVNAIRNDADLANLWDYLQSEMYLDDSIISFGIAHNSIFIYQVSDIDQKMAAVEQASTGSYQHDKVTVWKIDDSISAVQIDDYILIGQDSNMLTFIWTANNEDKSMSLYGNEYYRTIVDRLPNGYMLLLGVWHDEYDHLGGLADGMSVVNEGTDQLYTYIIKIEDEYAEYLRTEEHESIPADNYLSEQSTISGDLNYESMRNLKPPWWNE